MQLLLTALLPVFIFAHSMMAQETTWRTDIASGRRAVAEQRYSEADDLFTAALAKAEGLYQEALARNEDGLREEEMIAWSLLALADLYTTQSLHGRAVILYSRAITILDKTFSLEFQPLRRACEDYVEGMRKIGQLGEAIQLKPCVPILRDSPERKMLSLR
jgi:tetratricopeptide (TPR) repeat protein